MEASGVGDLVVDLVRASIVAEGKGQLNIGKLLRAAAAGCVRQDAAEKGFPDDSDRLRDELRGLSVRLGTRGFDPALCERLNEAAEVVARGEQSLIEQFPDPWICRRCGFASADAPTTHCASCGAHPLTFERFEPVYWTSVYAPPEVVDRLDANPGLFREALGRLPPERQAWTPPGVKWSAVDVFRHVRDADSVLAQRVTLILDEDDPALTFQPVFAWTDERAEEGESAEAILESYARTRRQTVTRLREISPDAWRRTGRHEELGRVSLAWQASYFAAHELTHLRQLEQLRRLAECA